MSTLPLNTAVDDRAQDDNLVRLRDAAAHLIDVVRRCVRTQLDAGMHPVDAITQGMSMLESWETGMTLTASPLPGSYTRQVDAVLTRLYERVGAERTWEWLREPNQALHGDTPLRALVGHELRRVAQLIDAMPPAYTAETPRSATGDVPAAGVRPSSAAHVPSVPRLTPQEYDSLVAHDLLPEKLELLDGRTAFGCDPATHTPYDVVFAPAQARAAAALGIRVYSAVDAVLRDPEAVRELLLQVAMRLSEGAGPPGEAPASEAQQ